ncbi:MAG TPA: 30S ribosomal protein THX, partial [Bacteroidales bacterium]|nr:30S ribosomal protein THX [Bacteroidales bacterium]
MGKGDKKTRRGKIILGSYGVRRPRKNNDKPALKPAKSVGVKPSKDKQVKEKKEVLPVKEDKETKAVKEVKEVKE